MNWSDEDRKRSFEKIAPCSCETTEVATAADDNIDFSNTFQEIKHNQLTQEAMKIQGTLLKEYYKSLKISRTDCMKVMSQTAS